MKYRAPGKCPSCGKDMEITNMRCKSCKAEIAGEFSLCRFCSLPENHLQFVETFLRCRGSIKEVEKALGVSYPTVKNMMDAALDALGFEESPQVRQEREKQERAGVLERLANKEIDVDTAISELNALKGGG